MEFVEAGTVPMGTIVGMLGHNEQALDPEQLRHTMPLAVVKKHVDPINFASFQYFYGGSSDSYRVSRRAHHRVCVLSNADIRVVRDHLVKSISELRPELGFCLTDVSLIIRLPYENAAVSIFFGSFWIAPDLLMICRVIRELND